MLSGNVTLFVGQAMGKVDRGLFFWHGSSGWGRNIAFDSVTRPELSGGKQKSNLLSEGRYTKRRAIFSTDSNRGFSGVKAVALRWLA